MTGNILVIGSINVDYVIQTDRLPKLGETLTGKNFAMNFGGKGANQAVALAKAGCNVKMLGAVGNDQAGTLAIENLTRCGVDTDAVFRTDLPTGAAVITVCGGDNHIILDVGANAAVTPEAVEQNRALLEWADILVMQYEIPTESVIFAAKTAHEMGKTVVVNPAPVKEVDTSALFPYVDLLIPNEFEAELITGIRQKNEEDAEKAIYALQNLGCANAIVTLGSRGCAFGSEKGVDFMGVYKITPVDSTAAGDSFIGGLCASLCGGASLQNAIAYASATSAITVSRAGAAVSIPTAEEVRAFIGARGSLKAR